MRPLFTWIVALVLMSVVTFSWYVTQPLVYAVISNSSTVFQGLGPSNSSSTRINQTYTLLQYINLLWGPIMDIFVLLWAVISSQRVDVESEYYD